jgi:hypothetical protein
MCREGHKEGITREQIEGALKNLPVVSHDHPSRSAKDL